MIKVETLAGLDIGHVSTKVALMKEREILGYAAVPTGLDVVALRPVLDKLGIPSTDFELDTTLPVIQFRTQLEAFIETIKGGVPRE